MSGETKKSRLRRRFYGGLWKTAVPIRGGLLSVIAAALKHMLAANMPHDAILSAVEDMERGLQTDEQAERRRAADRDRQRARRLRISAESVDKDDSPRVSVTRIEDKTLTSEIEPQVKEEKKGARERAFDAFWAIYPHKVGKADASKAFARAERRVDLDALMAGLRRYVTKTDDRPWCNPSTWLNQDRWADEPAPPVARAGPAPRPMNPTLAAAYRLKDEMDAVSPGQIEGNHPPPRLVAIGGRSG